MTWSTAKIDVQINEYKKVRPEPGNDELALLESALFLEGAFGILLSDEDITASQIGTYDSMRRFIIQRLDPP